MRGEQENRRDLPDTNGAPSGESRLSSYLVVIGTIVMTVLILTLHSVKYMETSFGGWDTKSASTIDIRTVGSISTTTTNHKEQFTASNSNLRANGRDENNGNNEEAFSEEEFPDAKYEEQTNEDAITKMTNDTTKKEPLVVPKMLDSVLDAHGAMIHQLRKDYGDEYFEKIFRRSGEESKDDDLTPEKLMMEYLPIRPFGPKDLYHTNHWGNDAQKAYETKTQPRYYHSIVNLRRKMMIKILTANDATKYVWATGGHSAAAGHGNLFHETYTKVMEATSSEVFQAAGLRLEARNYAMGATSSAAEMSMCFREVYGDDVDIFSWDFAMLEARDYLAGRLLHYATRGLLSNQHGVVPAFVGLQEVSSARMKMLEELHTAFRRDDDEENNGLALFLRDEDYWKMMKNAIPDVSFLSKTQNVKRNNCLRHDMFLKVPILPFFAKQLKKKNADLSTDEINQLPEFVKYFKCDGAIEKGFCEDYKYSSEICPERMGKASWHPGWKYNAIVGNSMALFLTEMLVGAVRQIEETIHSDDSDKNVSPEELLSNLMEEENSHRDRLFGAQASQLPTSFQKVFWYNNTSDDWKFYDEAERQGLDTGSEAFKARWSDLDREALFHGPSICHTARVPSQTRFFGHLTNQPEMSGEQVVFGKETYFTGIEEKEYHEMNKALPTEDLTKPRDMQLVWVKDKEREQTCGDVLAKPDYHDYFMTEEYEGWTTIEFPNKAEQDAYGYHQRKDEYKGILVIIPRFCGFGKCEEGFLGVNEYNEGKWRMKVNGRSVTAMTKIGHEAILLEHSDGIRFDPNGEGVYRLEFRVNEHESFIKISAFVLY